MQQIADLYLHMQMQGHALPWYPLQENPLVEYTGEGYPPLHSVLLPQAHPLEGYPHDVYPPPQQQLSQFHFPPPVGYLNDMYPLPPQQFNELHFFGGMNDR